MEEINRLKQLIDYNYDSINKGNFPEMCKIVRSLYKNAFKCEDPTIMNEWTENAQHIIELLELISDFDGDDTEASMDDEILDIRKEIKTIIHKQNVLLDRIVFKPPQETLTQYTKKFWTRGVWLEQHYYN